MQNGPCFPISRAGGIDQIDHMILTHTDTDHMGDLEVLATKVRIKEINISKGSLKKRLFCPSAQTIELTGKNVGGW